LSAPGNIYCKKCFASGKSKCFRCQPIYTVDIDSRYSSFDFTLENNVLRVSFEVPPTQKPGNETDYAIKSLSNFLRDHYHPVSRSDPYPPENFWDRFRCNHEWAFKEDKVPEVSCECLKTNPSKDPFETAKFKKGDHVMINIGELDTHGTLIISEAFIVGKDIYYKIYSEANKSNLDGLFPEHKLISFG